MEGQVHQPLRRDYGGWIAGYRFCFLSCDYTIAGPSIPLVSAWDSIVIGNVITPLLVPEYCRD